MPTLYMLDTLEQERFWRKVVRDGSGCWLWCGTLDKEGYGKCRFRGKDGCLAHRVAYFLTYGAETTRELDHVCNNRACVNPAHLRPVTRSENCCHARRYKNNTSGFKGVSRHSASRKWVARIQKSGIRYQLGLFDSAELAYRAYCAAAKNLHGVFAKTGD